MKFLRGIILSAVLGTEQELQAIENLFAFEADLPSFFEPAKGILYSGLIDFVREQLGSVYTIEVEDQYDRKQIPIKDISIPDNFIANGDPDYQDRTYQRIAAKKAIHHGRGVIELATGGGKTEIAAMVMKYLLEKGLAKKAYFVVGTRFLMKQAADRFERRGLQGVGRYGGGYRFRPATIQCCVIDSLMRALKDGHLEVNEDFAQCDVIFFDECHHLSAASWVLVGESCLAPYRFGLTATLWSDPFKYSHSDFYLIGLTGGLVAHVPSAYLRKKGYLADPLVTMLNIPGPPVRGWEWAKFYHDGVVRHRERNETILGLAQSLYDGGYRTLLFVNRISHGLSLTKSLRESGCRHVAFVKGSEEMYTWLPSGRWERRKTSIKELAEYVDDHEQVTIIGNTVVDEGIDVPAFNALIMATAMKKYRRTVQRAGRGMRPKKEGNRVFIFDFIDGMHNTLLNHSLYRVATYRLEEFEFADSLDDACEAMGIPILLEGAPYQWEDYKEDRKRKRRRRSA